MVTTYGEHLKSSFLITSDYIPTNYVKVRKTLDMLLAALMCDINFDMSGIERRKGSNQLYFQNAQCILSLCLLRAGYAYKVIV